MNYDEITQKHLANLKSKIQARMSEKNIDATGEASQSLEIKGNQLLGANYIYYLDKGRAPGGWPPISNLRSWIRAKLNLDIKEERQAMFLIGRKIARDGTEIFRNSSKGLQLDSLIDETIDEITKELPDQVAAEALKWL